MFNVDRNQRLMRSNGNGLGAGEGLSGPRHYIHVNKSLQPSYLHIESVFTSKC